MISTGGASRRQTTSMSRAEEEELLNEKCDFRSAARAKTEEETTRRELKQDPQGRPRLGPNSSNTPKGGPRVLFGGGVEGAFPRLEQTQKTGQPIWRRRGPISLRGALDSSNRIWREEEIPSILSRPRASFEPDPRPIFSQVFRHDDAEAQ